VHFAGAARCVNRPHAGTSTGIARAQQQANASSCFADGARDSELRNEMYNRKRTMKLEMRHVRGN
jgi:hypothetical protein